MHTFFTLAFWVAAFLTALAMARKKSTEAASAAEASAKNKIAAVGGLLLFLGVMALATSEDESKVPAEAAATASNETAAKLPQADSASTQSAAPLMKPEMIVRFPESSIACLSREALSQVTQHFLRGEKTKGLAFFQGKDNPDGTCVMLDPARTFKVLAVEYNDVKMPGLGIMEIVGVGSKSSDGAWAFTTGATQVLK